MGVLVDQVLASHLLSHLLHFFGRSHFVNTGNEAVFSKKSLASGSDLYLGLDDETFMVVAAKRLGLS